MLTSSNIPDYDVYDENPFGGFALSSEAEETLDDEEYPTVDRSLDDVSEVEGEEYED